MNEVSESVVVRLKDKLSVVIDAYEKLEAVNSQLLVEKTKLTEAIRGKDEVIEQLERKVETLVVAKSFASSSEDTHEGKLKINKIVREIDKCIALLNR
ncbi:MAG TPA: hypothetical protein VMV56_07920 [Williamwhitmania sp.]|nr:hypothetical protein [Williamwhitmania sp.]